MFIFMNPIWIEASKRPGVMADIDCLKKEMQVQQIGGDAATLCSWTGLLTLYSLASLSQMEKTSSREDGIQTWRKISEHTGGKLIQKAVILLKQWAIRAFRCGGQFCRFGCWGLKKTGSGGCCTDPFPAVLVCYVDETVWCWGERLLKCSFVVWLTPCQLLAACSQDNSMGALYLASKFRSSPSYFRRSSDDPYKGRSWDRLSVISGQSWARSDKDRWRALCFAKEIQAPFYLLKD